jgi:lysophospholipase L1-like esterase
LYLQTGVYYLPTPPYASTTPNTAYIPPGAPTVVPLSKWIAAKGRGVGGPQRIAIAGDSNVAGEGGGASTTNALGLDGAQPFSWAARLALLVGAETGQFFGEGNAAAGSVTPASYDPRLTLAGNWAIGGSVATYGGRLFVASTTSGGDLTFTPGTPWDTADIWYVTNTNGTTQLLAKIDGVTAATYNTLSAAEGLVKATVTTTYGVHTLSFSTTTTNVGIVLGAACRNSTSGKPVAYIGGNCAQTSTYFALDNHAWTFRSCVRAFDPDLFIFACTINDGKAAITKAAYKANVLSVVASAPNADIVLVVAYPSSHASSTNGTIDGYRDALAEIAAITPNCRVIDCREVYGWSNAQATAYGYVFDADHPNVTGHAAQANYIYQTLLPAGL